jgi:predicted PurR-regulated permease PerM
MGELGIFIVILIIAGVVSVAGAIFWLVFFVWLAKSAFKQAESELGQLLPQIDQMLKAADKMSPQQKNQIAQMLMQANTHMGQLNDLSRQRYENTMGDLTGMAASAGIDWTPPAF